MYEVVPCSLGSRQEDSEFPLCALHFLLMMFLEDFLRGIFIADDRACGTHWRGVSIITQCRGRGRFTHGERNRDDTKGIDEQKLYEEDFMRTTLIFSSFFDSKSRSYSAV